MSELALFAGAGGGILGGKLLGWRTVCAVERDAYAAQILAQRQTDGCLEPFPIWSDVCSFDGRPWRGRIDVISGGFPCQDISSAGKGAGIDGARSGLWSEFKRIVREVEPRWVYVENSPTLTSRGLGRILRDLAEMGFNAEWGVLGAHNADAPHERDRIWVLAYADSVEHKSPSHAWQRQRESSGAAVVRSAWPFEPEISRVAYGVAYGVDQIRAIGNGQVSRVAAAAFTILSRRADECGSLSQHRDATITL
jgi:DNA (cytosine-5)-methyltransferase 1